MIPADPPSGKSTRARPEVAEIFRPRPEERLEGSDQIAAAAPVIAPALVLGAVAAFFVPALNRYAPLLVVGLLTLTPVALVLGWRPGGSPGRARTATAITTILVGFAAGGLGLLANPCVANPIVVGVVGAGLFSGTLLLATAIGRWLAQDGRLVAPILAGGVGFVGFYGSLVVVGSNVFVLC